MLGNTIAVNELVIFRVRYRAGNNGYCLEFGHYIYISTVCSLRAWKRILFSFHLLSKSFMFDGYLRLIETYIVDIILTDDNLPDNEFWRVNRSFSPVKITLYFAEYKINLPNPIIVNLKIFYKQLNRRIIIK